MSLTTVEKLELLGFQFWEKKSSEGPDVKEKKDYFIVIQSILFCFPNPISLDTPFGYIERFMSSVAKSLNTNETCKFLDFVPEGEPIKKIIYFGENFNKDFLEKEFPDANFNISDSCEHLFSNSQSKKDLWLSIKD